VPHHRDARRIPVTDRLVQFVDRRLFETESFAGLSCHGSVPSPAPLNSAPQPGKAQKGKPDRRCGLTYTRRAENSRYPAVAGVTRKRHAGHLFIDAG
jgi:hypothetical protein